jgi:ADP-ribosyl-[dinitrogen reductase] hydrolase
VTRRDRYRGALLGLAAGDALGTTVEFEPPGSFEPALIVAALEGKSFRDGCLAAANLGDDADTTAAVCGQLAGAYYGAHAIPPDWVRALALGNWIEELADGLLALPEAL